MSNKAEHDALKAKANAWNAKIIKLANGMHRDGLEPWQISLLLMAAASYAGRQGGVPLDLFLSHVRECVQQEYGITICGMAVEDPQPSQPTGARVLKFPKEYDA